MQKTSVLSGFDRRLGEDLFDGKVRKYVDSLRDSFRQSLSSSSLPQLVSVRSSVPQLKQHYSKLLYSNSRKEELLLELRSALHSLTAINTFTTEEKDLALSARSAEITVHPGSDRINRVKKEAAEVEGLTEKEESATNQLLFMIKQTKESNVRRIQTQLKQRIHQITTFRDRVLKDAPKIKTLLAESVNDLTHSVYTLQKRREEAKSQRGKIGHSLKTQQDSMRRYEGENEDLMQDVARKVIFQQETAAKTRLIIQDCDDTFKKRRDRIAALARSEGKVHSFKSAMSRLESLVHSSQFLQSHTGQISISTLIAHYNELVMQSNSLNNRYVSLTETEAALIARLKKLQEELKGLKQSAADFPEMHTAELQAAWGITHNEIRARIEEKAECEDVEVERVQAVEVMQIYSFLFMQESREKLGATLSKLKALVSAEYLVPQWGRVARLESFTGTLPGSEEGPGTSPNAVMLARLCADLPTLRLSVTPNDVKIALSVPQVSIKEALIRLFETSTSRFNERFCSLVTNLTDVYRTLIRETTKVETDVDLLQLTQEQQSQYENIEAEALLRLAAPRGQRHDRRKLSTIVRGILEFKLKQASNSQLQELKSDFHNYMSTFYRLPQKEDSEHSSFGQIIGAEDSSDSEVLQDGDISKLLRHTEHDQPKAREKQAKRFDFTTRSYERTVLAEVAKTESKIKEVVEKSEF